MDEKKPISEIIQELNKLSKKEIKDRIDGYFIWKDYGEDYVRKLGDNAFLDSLSNENINLVFISDYCDKLLNIKTNKIDIDKLVKRITILGIIPIILAALEIIKIIKEFFSCNPCH